MPCPVLSEVARSSTTTTRVDGLGVINLFGGGTQHVRCRVEVVQMLVSGLRWDARGERLTGERREADRDPRLRRQDRHALRARAGEQVVACVRAGVAGGA